LEEFKLKKLAVFFPGIGYHTDKPLLYYSRDIAYECGYLDYISVSYKYEKRDNLRGNKEAMKEVFKDLYFQTDKFLKDIKWTEYTDVVFVSKSVGTAIACAYSKKHNIKCKQVLYTPLEETFDFEPQNAIVFTGSSDPWVKEGAVSARCQNLNIPIRVFDNANHSLETDDTINNIESLKSVMIETKKFLTNY